jgi:gamma-glutamyl-gamma-aminobutyrate hydrolase PuuD
MVEQDMTRPIILISQRVDHFEQRNETRDSLDQALSLWVIASNALPLHLPNVLLPEMLTQLLTQLKPSGIILSGGNNVGEHYDRDYTETILLDWAKLNQVPVLGICRGMQFIGKWSGTGLQSVVKHVAVRHEIRGVLSAIVNSYHDYVLDAVPDGFCGLAYSHDGHLEAIQSITEWPCEAWMWHPERDSPFDPIWLARFRSLMKLK